MLLVLGLVIASIPTYAVYLHLLRVAHGLAPADPGGQLTKGGIQELQTWGLSLNIYIAYLVIGNLLLVLSYLGMGTLIVWRTWGKTNDWMALCAAYVLVTFPVNVIALMLFTLPPSWGVPINILRFLGEICISLFGCLFPIGRFVPRWSGFLALGSVIVWGIFIFVPAASSPSSILAAIIFVLILLSLGCIVGVQVYRYRRVSNPTQRQQTKWVIFGLLLFAGGIMVWTGLSALLYFQGMFADVLVRSLFNVSQIFLWLLIPFSISFAILRYRLWDIDIIINRTLVYGILTMSVIGIYALVVGTLGALLQVQGNFFIALLGAGLVAVLFQPLRLRLQSGVNRLMYGERDTPDKVISRLGQRLETTLAPDAVLPTIVETVAKALKLPYTAITLKSISATNAVLASEAEMQGSTLKQSGAFVPAASFGQVPEEDLVHLPLVYQNEQIGELLLAPRAPGETFAPADRALLSDLARQAGIAAHAVRLTADLQRLAVELQHSRIQLVTTREEERRRLRRDLHDGLGPALGSLTLQLDTARNLFKSDQSAADVLLIDLKAQVQAAIADIRRLVYELRPPTLDELGLVSALREQVTRYRKPGLSITLNAPEHLPPLPAAVEVAIYRIAQEALTNVVRHANARHCTLSLEVDDHVCLEIRDDGQGLAADYRVGVGLTSMRERAAELGGTCVIGPIEAGGTRVFIRLSLAKEQEHGRTYPRADR